MQSGGQDWKRRKIPRFECKDVWLNYRRKKSILASLLKIEPPKSPPRPVRNINRDGLCFLTKEKLQNGEDLIFSLRFNPREPRIEIEGEVLWIRPGEGHYPYMAGVGFTNVPRHIWEFLSHMERHCRKKENSWQSWTLHGRYQD